MEPTTKSEFSVLTTTPEISELTATVSDLELSLPLISQDDKDELAVRDNRDIKIDRQYSILAEQLIARQVWLEMVVGSNCQQPRNPYANPQQ